jgi:hypothetical protein
MLRSYSTFGLLFAAFCVPSSGQENWTPMFNGKDLSGWVIVNVAPNTFTARWDDREHGEADGDDADGADV